MSRVVNARKRLERAALAMPADPSTPFTVDQHIELHDAAREFRTAVDARERTRRTRASPKRP